MIIIIFLSMSMIYAKHMLNDMPFLLGPYNLRISNDKKIKTGLFTQLILNKNDEIKLKTTLSNGLFAYKTSRSGVIKKWKINNYFSLLNKEFILNIEFTNINKYSYSILGLEFPEFRYQQSSYDIKKNVLVKYKVQNERTWGKDNSIYIQDLDTNNFYIFDLTMPNEKRPFSETQLNTFIFTQIIGIIINIIITKNIHF